MSELSKKRKYRKRSFRRLTKRISVYSIPKDQHRSTSTNYNDVLLSVVDTWYITYAEQLLLNERVKSSNSIDWRCYHCKAKISVNIYNLLKHNKNISESSMFCNNCKNIKVNSLAKPFFYRYLNDFYSHVRSMIKQNSNISKFI